MGRIPASRALALGLALSCAQAPAQEARGEGLVVGVLREDALGHAFARQVGAGWQAVDPKAPLPERWWLVPLHGAVATPTQVRRTTATTVVEDCYQMPLFRTDAEPGSVPGNTCPVDKRGLLFSQAISTVRPEMPSQDDPTRRRLEALVAAKVAEFERQRAKAGDLGLTPNGEGCRRKKVGAEDADAWPCVERTASMTVDRVAIPGVKQRFLRIVYTGKGRQQRLDPYECGDTLYQAWFAESQDRLAAIDERFDLPDCDYKGITTETPVLGFEHAGRAYLVTVVHGWESESYALSELTAKGLVRLADDSNAGH